jgi:hypothetical protein
VIPQAASATATTTEVILMQHINDKMLELFLRLKSQDGQGALEYIGMVIGLAILVAAGFQIAGYNIMDEASSFVGRVLNSATTRRS